MRRCENCQILIGRNHVFKKSFDYFGRKVCSDCFKRLNREFVTGKKEWSKSLNDKVLYDPICSVKTEEEV